MDLRYETIFADSVSLGCKFNEIILQDNGLDGNCQRLNILKIEKFVLIFHAFCAVTGILRRMRE